MVAAAGLPGGTQDGTPGGTQGGTRGDGGRDFRRRVFYVPGYDPFPPLRYRMLYRAEGEKQAAISGYRLKVMREPAGGAFGWRTQAQVDGGSAQARVTVLVWSDLVRESMRSGVVGMWWLFARTLWVYAASGALAAMFRVRRAPMLAAAYPAMMLLGQLGLALGLGAVPLAVLPLWAGGPLALAVAWAVLAGFRRLDGRLFAHYLLHDYAYAARHGGAWDPALEGRLADWTAQVRAALDSDADEALVVGHSSGAALAVSLVADVLRQGARPDGGAALGLLTLGQAIPMQSFLPGARRLRRDLHDLAARTDMFWLDVSAPGDGCCFGLADPVAVTGVAPPDQRWPLVISAAFSQTLRPETWARLKRRFFRLHFQYLAAFDRPGDYDYFRITAGPLTLARRFAGRAASPQRISAAQSPHRSLT